MRTILFNGHLPESIDRPFRATYMSNLQPTTSLLTLKNGHSGRISSIEGGKQMVRRMLSLGLRVGVKVKKLSTQVMSGPITIQIGSSKVALGRGMAKKIFINDGEK